MLATGARAQEVVTSFAPAGTTDSGVWFENGMRGPEARRGARSTTGLVR